MVFKGHSNSAAKNFTGAVCWNVILYCLQANWIDQDLCSSYYICCHYWL